MGIAYNYGLPNLPLFLWDAQTASSYLSTSESANIINGKSAIRSGAVNVVDSGLGKTYTFNNSTNSFNASARIQYNPFPSEYDQHFLLLNGCSAFVTFRNTSLLSTSAPTYYRQVPFSMDYDSGLGAWNFERFYTSSSYVLRVKFDQDGTFGFTAGFGDVPLNQVWQLGFTIRDNFLHLYSNGSLVNSVNISSKTLNGVKNTSRSIGVGGMNGAIYGFIGQIYNAAWWNNSLTDDQVRLFYNQTISRYS